VRRAIFALAAAASLHAQVKVAGRVVDENSVAVAGARVEFRAGANTTAASSDTAGYFNIALEQPGEYAVRAERPGFFVFTGSVRFVEGDNRLSLVINHLQEFAESVDVVYSPPAIDLQEPAETRQLTNVEIMEAPYPSPHDLRAALPLFQNVVPDAQGRLHFNGGAEDQVNLRLDGFNIADPATGRLEARVNIDSVQTLELESSRFSAEHGRGSAGSLNIRTRMGDDKWRFSGTNFVPGVDAHQGVYINKWTPRAQVSGPLARGRAWFHNGFDVFYDVDVVTELPRGEDRARSFTVNNLSRAQVNLTPSNILSGGLLVNFTDAEHRGLSFIDPLETTIDQRQNWLLLTLKDQIYFRRGALVEIGFAASGARNREEPQGGNPYLITPFGRRGNYFVDRMRRTERQQWVANLSLAPQGAHQPKFGIDFQRSRFHQTVARHEYQVLRTDLSLARQVYFQGNQRQLKTNFETAVYAEDRWSVTDNVLLEFGLRADWDQVVRDVLVSPRFAAAFAPRRLRDTKFAVGFGTFYDALSLRTLTRHQDQISLATFYSPNGTISRGPVETFFLADEEALRAPRYRTFSVTVDRKLSWQVYGRASYTRRNGRRGLTFLNEVSATEGIFHLYNARNDRYDALELTLRRTFAGQYEWVGGYTRSSTRSDSVMEFSLENPVFGPQGPGPLAWDAPHRFLTWGWAPVPRRPWPGWLRRIIGETTLAYLVEYRTGFPFSVVNDESYLLGAPNSTRFPNYFNVNLHLERKFRLLHYLWAWRFGVNNITNNVNANSVNNNVDSPSFLTYGRGPGRAFSVRLRFLGKR
jgi:hypothetical protein